MWRKIFSTLVLSAMIFIGSQTQAQDVYVGTSNATGWDCYLMTETMRDINANRFEATLKMVTRSKSVKYLDYTFWRDNGGSSWWFSNSSGYSGRVDANETPIEWNIWRAFRGSPKAY